MNASQYTTGSFVEVVEFCASSVKRKILFVDIYHPCMDNCGLMRE